MRLARVMIPILPLALAAGPAASPPTSARQLLARAAEAMGGAERIDSVRTLQQAGPLTLKMGTGEMEVETRQVFVYPDRMRVEVVTMAGRITRVITPDAAFVGSVQGTKAMDDAARRESETRMRRDLILLLKSRNDPVLRAVAAGTTELGGRTIDRVSVELRGVPSTLGIDRDSGRLVTLSYPGKHPATGATGEFQTVYSDFREVNGVLFPFTQEVTFEGEASSSLTCRSVEIDAPVSKALFEKPAGGGPDGR